MDLPPQVLTMILSYMTTKQAVQTSLIAKSFQTLWGSVTALNFNLEEFNPDGTAPEDEVEENFVKFVEGVFEHREPLTLDSFKIVWEGEENNTAPATSWLDTVTKWKPMSISARISSESCNFKVPGSIFACQSLHQLELQLDYQAISAMTLKLPCLKKLTFHSVEIGDGFIQSLSRLPALEELVLCYCRLNISVIFSNTLKHLVLDRYQVGTLPDIAICAPHLLYLEICSWEIRRIKFKSLKSVVRDNNPYSVFLCEPLTDLVINLQLVTYRVIKPDHVNLPRLKRLTFSFVLMMDDMLKKLIEGCPSLEELVLISCDLRLSQITSGSVKLLALDNCTQNDHENPEIFISTPNLEQLEIISCYMGQLKFNPMPFLKKAFIIFRGPIIDHHERFSNYEPVFLRSLWSATTLSLELKALGNDYDYVKVMKHIEKEMPNFPIFRNLKKLKIGGWCMSREFGPVALFLQHSPNLEKLILVQSKYQTLEKTQSYSSNRGASDVLSSM